MNSVSLNLHQTMKEEWRDVRGYKGLYQVSNLGEDINLEREELYKW